MHRRNPRRGCSRPPFDERHADDGSIAADVIIVGQCVLSLLVDEAGTEIVDPQFRITGRQATGPDDVGTRSVRNKDVIAVVRWRRMGTDVQSNSGGAIGAGLRGKSAYRKDAGKKGRRSGRWVGRVESTRNNRLPSTQRYQFNARL